MSLSEITINLPKSDRLNGSVEKWLQLANEHIDQFFETEENKRYPLFLPSESEDFTRTMEALKDQKVIEGNVFCEWGSGFGVHTGIASILGFESHGIEFEPELVSQADKLAQSGNIELEYHCTSFVPEGFDCVDGMAGTELLVPEYINSDEGFLYEGTDLVTTDVDVFYVYPRPDDQDFVLKLFEATARHGAILVTWFGVGAPLVFSKED